MKRRLWAVILTLAMTLPLTGCIDTVSIGERLLVQAMGIDGGPEGFTITLQVFTPAPAGQQQGGSTGTVSASDENLAECLSKIYRDTGKRPFFGGCRLVLLGKNVYSESREEVTGLLLSDHELRPGTPLLLTEDAAALTAAVYDGESVPAVRLEEVWQTACREGLCPESTLLMVIRSQQSLGETSALAVIADAGGAPVIEGTAIFPPDDTPLSLTPEAWRGAAILTGGAEAMEYRIPYRGGELRVCLHSQAVLGPGEQDGSLRLTVDIGCSVLGYTGDKLHWESEEAAGIRAAVERTVRRETETAFSLLRETGADVFCGLETVKKFFPDHWQGHSREEIWDSLTLTVDAAVRITSLGPGADASR